MNTKSEYRVKTLREKVAFTFGMIMFLVYFSLGLALVFIPELLSEYDKHLKIGIGCTFIAYSFFRLYRIVRSTRNINRYEE